MRWLSIHIVYERVLCSDYWLSLLTLGLAHSTYVDLFDKVLNERDALELDRM